MIKAIFFDLDGTLLPMDEKKFTEVYFSTLFKKLEPYHYDRAKLMPCFLEGVMKMVNNDGRETNGKVFWESFEKIFPDAYKRDGKVFRKYYENEFSLTKSETKDNPLAKEIINHCKKNSLKVILSTNPIFPKEAQEKRLSFIDLKISDFDYVTDYSNSCYCKPNPKYFLSLLNQFSLSSDEVILFGNDYIEDGKCASSLGIKTYLVDGCLLHKEKCDMNFSVIKMDEIMPTIDEEIKKNK